MVSELFVLFCEAWEFSSTAGVDPLVLLSSGGVLREIAITRDSEGQEMSRFGMLALVAAVCIAPYAQAGCGTCDKTIVENASKLDGFKTLVAAVKAAGLVETLSGDGPFTVFAPTDEAFKKLPEGTVESLLKPENKDQLIDILKYHVVPGKVMAKDVVGLTEAKAANGKKLRVKVADGKVKINQSNVVKTDVASSNGVIHVVDKVILPKAKKK